MTTILKFPGNTLFDARCPTLLRSDGLVNNVCFLKGLVYFNDKWFLYYGTADSKIAVAVANSGK